MQLFQLVVGALQANCYIVGCEESREALVIDPGGDVDRIVAVLEEHNLKLCKIVNTHGHIDHTGGNKWLSDRTGAPILIHNDDAAVLGDAVYNLSASFGLAAPSSSVGQLLEDGDVIEVGRVCLTVIHTPGHTPGSICLWAKDEEILFTGDTLFAGGVGRTDLPGGSWELLLESIRGKLLVLGDKIKVYPGHGDSSSIGVERKVNPFI